MLSHSSGGWNSKIEVFSRSFWSLKHLFSPLLASGDGWKSLTFLGLETHHARLCLWLPMMFFLFVSKFLSPSKDTSHSIWGSLYSMGAHLYLTMSVKTLISRQGHIPRHQGLGRGHKTTHAVSKVRTRQDHSRLQEKLLTWQLPTGSWICTRQLRPTAPSPWGARPPPNPILRPTHTGSSGLLGNIPKETMTPEDIRPTRHERPITPTMRFRPWNPGLCTTSACGQRGATWPVLHRASLNPQVSWAPFYLVGT